MGCFGAGTACFRAAQALVWGLFGLLFDALRTKVCSFPMRYVFPSVALSGAAFAGVPFSVLKKSAFGGNECRERVRRDESRLYVADFPCGF